VNLGAPELLIIVGLFLYLGLVIWGAVVAGQNGDTGWLVGILVGLLFGVGWIVALIYLVISSGRRTA
jgi:hypothetical protein